MSKITKYGRFSTNARTYGHPYIYTGNLGTLAWQELPLRVLFTGKTKQATDCMVNDSM